MTQLSENPDREELRNFYESNGDPPVDCHANYGDVNPEPHGGDWVTYDPEYGSFELVSTFRAEEVGFDVPEESLAQYVSQAEAYFEDIVTEDGDLTDSARRTADSLHGAQEDPAGLIIDGRFTWFVVAWLAERTEGYHVQNPIEEESYGAVLDRFGVDPCDE